MNYGIQHQNLRCTHYAIYSIFPSKSIWLAPLLTNPWPKRHHKQVKDNDIWWEYSFLNFCDILLSPIRECAINRKMRLLWMVWKRINDMTPASRQIGQQTVILVQLSGIVDNLCVEDFKISWNKLNAILQPIFLLAKYDPKSYHIVIWRIRFLASLQMSLKTHHKRTNNAS